MNDPKLEALKELQISKVAGVLANLSQDFSHIFIGMGSVTHYVCITQLHLPWLQ